MYLAIMLLLLQMDFKIIDQNISMDTKLKSIDSKSI